MALEDGYEFISLTDSLDLTKKETVILEFEEFDASNAGVIITHRQSLLTTFLFYSGLAQMGNAVGGSEW